MKDHLPYELFEWWFFVHTKLNIIYSTNHIRIEIIFKLNFYTSPNFFGYFPSTNMSSLTFIYCCLFVAQSLNISCCSVEFSLASIRISVPLSSIFIYLYDFKECLSFINSAIIKPWYHDPNIQKVSVKWENQDMFILNIYI